MKANSKPQSNQDPFSVLGLPPGADQDRVRARYLELVKRHPPERDPEKFRELHRAYEAARDPLTIAERLVRSDIDDEPQPWAEIIDEHRSRPPRLNSDLLLSLGNRSAAGQRDGQGTDADPS